MNNRDGLAPALSFFWCVQYEQIDTFSKKRIARNICVITYTWFFLVLSLSPTNV